MSRPEIVRLVEEILQFLESEYRDQLGDLLPENPELEMTLKKTLEQWRPGITMILAHGLPLPRLETLTVEDLVKQLNARGMN